jgi:adenylate cyclase
LLETTQAFERFVPHDFLNHLKKKSILDVNLGDCVKMEMSVMFADIRDFTSLSEGMTPHENFNFVNSVLKNVGPIIRKHDGFIDKYIGDAVMALFDQGADSALNASVALLHGLEEYNNGRNRAGYNPIKIGVGINTGDLMMGIIGEHGRMEGTVISDAVNLAARMETLTKTYGASILISDQTFQNLKDPKKFDYRIVDKVVVKGKTKAVTVIEVCSGDLKNIREGKKRTIEIFEKAIRPIIQSSFKKHWIYLNNVFQSFLKIKSLNFIKDVVNIT